MFEVFQVREDHGNWHETFAYVRVRLGALSEYGTEVESTGHW